MTIVVNAPDKSTHNFPDGTSQAQIVSEMKKYTQETAADNFAKRFLAPDDKMESGGADVQQILEGASLGWSDKLMAAGVAAGTGIGNFGLNLMGERGDFTPTQAYSAALKRFEQRSDKFQKEHPYRSAAEQGVGMLLTPGSAEANAFIKGGETVAGTIGRVAAVGAGYGAVGGAGQGDFDPWQRALHAVYGAGIGAPTALLGHGAAHLISEHGSQLLGAAGDVVKDTVKLLYKKSPAELKKTLTPEQFQQVQDHAIDYLLNERYAAQGLKPGDLTQHPAYKLGLPVTAAEVGGQQGLLAALARRSGTTAKKLADFLSRRGKERPARLRAATMGAFGINPEHVEADFEEQQQLGREANKPLYERAWAHDAPGMQLENSEFLQNMLTRPSVESGLGWAYKLAKEESVKPENIGLVWRTERRPNPMAEYFNNEPKFLEVPVQVEVRNPTMKTWDYILRGVDQYLKGEPTAAGFTTRHVLSDYMKEHNPFYREAVAHSGEVITNRQAYEAAPKHIFDSNQSQYQFDKWWDGLTPAQQQAAKGGIVKHLDTLLDAKQRKQTETLENMASEGFHGKLTKMLGAEKANRLMQHVEGERQMRAFENWAPSGKQSISSEMLDTMQELDEKMTPDREKLIQSVRKAGGFTKAVSKYAQDKLWAPFLSEKVPVKAEMQNQLGHLLTMPPEEQQHAIMEYIIRSGTLPATPQSARSVMQTLRTQGPAAAAARLGINTARGVGRRLTGAVTGGLGRAIPAIKQPTSSYGDQ